MPEPEISSVLAPPARTYAAKHLSFRKVVIEPLGMDEVFEVVTPAGTFRMKRGDLYAVFPEVVSSVSYRDRGEYHFPKIPYKAFRFLVREKKGAEPPAPEPDSQ